MVLRRNKVEIGNYGPEISESEKAIEVEATSSFTENFPNHAYTVTQILRWSEQTPPQARPTAKGEFQ